MTTQKALTNLRKAGRELCEIIIAELKLREILGWISCRAGGHDWTCAHDQGINVTQAQVDAGVDGFLDYAKMYCSRCGHVSRLSR